MDDHARLRTGGTCFSLTNTLRRITTDLGFTAYPVMADMRHGENIHCALLVELGDRRYLLDPGYLVAEPVPLRSHTATEIRFPGSRLEYRPLGSGREFELHTVNERGETALRYRLRPRRIPENDFIRYWLESFDAPGMNSLYLNRITSEGRLSAHNLNLRIDSGRGKMNVKLCDNYDEAIAERFDIEPRIARRAFEEWERHRCRR
jgi:arylamine N-acetyltransferase